MTEELRTRQGPERWPRNWKEQETTTPLGWSKSEECCYCSPWAGTSRRKVESERGSLLGLTLWGSTPIYFSRGHWRSSEENYPGSPPSPLWSPFSVLIGQTQRSQLAEIQDRRDKNESESKQTWDWPRASCRRVYEETPMRERIHFKHQPISVETNFILVPIGQNVFFPYLLFLSML